MKRVLLFFEYKTDRWARAGPHGIAKRLIAWSKRNREWELIMIELSNFPLYLLSMFDSHIFSKYNRLFPVKLLDIYKSLLLKLRICICSITMNKLKKLFHDADLIQIHGPVGFIALLKSLPEVLKTKPIILAHHAPGAQFRYLTRQFPRMEKTTYLQKIKEFEYLAFKFIDTVIVPSRHTLDLLQQDLPEINLNEKRIYIIYNGIKPVHGSKGKIRRALNIPCDAFVISTIAKLIRDKGVDVIIKATHILKTKYLVKNLYLIIRGSGPELPYLKRLVREIELSGEVRFLSYVQNIEDLYIDSNVFVMAQRRAAFDLTVLEALSAGVPVVVSDIGGNVEAVGSAGLRFKSEDAHALAKTIYKLYVDHELRDTLSKKALEVFRERYTLETMANNYIRVYQERIRESCTSRVCARHD